MSNQSPQSSFADETLPAQVQSKEFIYRHIVCFEETNLVGNVYFVRHIAWQGRCREMFLREHAPGVLDDLAQDLRLVTLRVECEYFDEFRAFDTIELRMRLVQQAQNRIALEFDYMLVQTPESFSLAARGTQEIGCMRETGNGLVPTDVPPDLQTALRAYGRI